MGRILNIRNREQITNPHILNLIKECLDNTKKMGFAIPSNLRFLQCEAKRRAGVACYRDTTIVLSTFIFKEQDPAIKSIIYHEIGHIVAGPGAKHGPVWKKVVNKMTRTTGIKITRLYSDADMPIHAVEKQRFYKYIFKCKDCGCIVRYTKMTSFVKTYDQEIAPGRPRWTCSRCGSTFEKVQG